jgi:hypothetical protein
MKKLFLFLVLMVVVALASCTRHPESRVRVEAKKTPLVLYKKHLVYDKQLIGNNTLFTLVSPDNKVIKVYGYLKDRKDYSVGQIIK